MIENNKNNNNRTRNPKETSKPFSSKPVHHVPVKNYLIVPIFKVDIGFVSLTNRKVVRENIVVGHSTQAVHPERPLTDLKAPVGTYELRSFGGEQ